MKSLFIILFVIFASIYGITAIYTKMLLKKNNTSVTFFYTEFSDYKNLWILAKKQKKVKPLLFLFISSTILSLLMFFLIIIC
jgi:hypothetical protein